MNDSTKFNHTFILCLEAKDERKNNDICWKLIDRASDFNPTTRKGQLYLKEKYPFIFKPDRANVTNRSELLQNIRLKKNQQHQVGQVGFISLQH